MIGCYQDFVRALIAAGFSFASSGKKENVFSLIPFDWDEGPADSPIRWHTGDRDFDPWEWRIRVLEERDDIAYGKIFFNKGGFITKEFAPMFLKARKATVPLMDCYQDGNLSREAKRIYEVVAAYDQLPLHLIKQEAAFSKEDKSKFDRALTQLQMKMYLTMCGTEQKRKATGEEYGWSSTVFCTAQSFWGEEIIHSAEALSEKHAYDIIYTRITTLNPNADTKKASKFILGI